MMSLGSSSPCKVEQPKDDNNFNNVDIERKTRKEIRHIDKETRKRLHAKRKLMRTKKERELIHKKNHVFLVYNKQAHKVIMPILHQLEKLFKIVAQQCKCKEM
jgi:hypothetical protein